MFAFSRSAATSMVLAVCLFGSASAWAEGTILTGMFDGSEPQIAALWNNGYCSNDPSGYRQTRFKVSETGYYSVSDAFAWHGKGQRVNIGVYKGSFNPAALEQNQVQSSDFVKGVDYVLVLQKACKKLEGAWAVAVVGPGSVISDAVAEVPSFTSGSFTKSDPVKTVSWQNAPVPYKQSGPVRVSRDGTYYFANMYFSNSVEVALLVYTAPFNPANPEANLVTELTWSNWLTELQAGQDYYFVTQRASSVPNTEFLYLFARLAPFRINPGLSGAWYNPDTPGQGFFLTIYEKRNQVFMGWFTFTDDPAPANDYGHRWMTAFGKFEGPSADLALEWTSGGGFDSATPVPEQITWGEIDLDFTDCATGTVTYAFGPDDTGGYRVEEIPIQRHTDDSVALCESLYAGPGMPGPL